LQALFHSIRHTLTRTALALLLATSVSAQDLEIHFLEVGHGNAALVVGPDGTTVLIDGGVTGQGDITILPYMSSLGLTELTYGISTHYHVDHLGGLDEVYDQIGGPAIAFDRGDNQPWMTTQYDEYLVSVAGVRATPTVGQTLALGNGATLEFVCLNGDWSGGSVDPHLFAQGENGSSVGVIIRYGDFDAWIAGDLTGGGEGTADIESLVRFDIGQVEVVLAGHHGSETSSNAAFVDTLDPSLVIYSCGLNNAGGVPDEAVIERWNAPDASRVVWSTSAGDTSGDLGGFVVTRGHIVVASDGSTFRAESLSSGGLTDFVTHEQPSVAPAAGDLVLTEWLVDPVQADDDYGQWFELLNVSGADRCLDGVQFESGSDSFILATSLVCRAGERVVIGNDGDTARNGNLFLTLGAPWDEFELDDDDGSLTVRAPDGTVIDSIAWGPGAVPVTPGAASERIHALGGDAPSNHAPAQSAWDAGDFCTPHRVNDNASSPCPPPLPYCIAAPNSTGAGATISIQGSSNVLTDDLVLVASQCPASEPGLFFYGTGRVSTPFGDGYRCVGGTVFRLGPFAFSDAGGQVTYAVDYDSLHPGGALAPGSSWDFQFWYRDPAGMGGSSFNTTNAMTLQFCWGVVP